MNTVQKESISLEISFCLAMYAVDQYLDPHQVTDWIVGWDSNPRKAFKFSRSCQKN